MLYSRRRDYIDKHIKQKQKRKEILCNKLYKISRNSILFRETVCLCMSNGIFAHCEQYIHSMQTIYLPKTNIHPRCGKYHEKLMKTVKTFNLFA